MRPLSLLLPLVAGATLLAAPSVAHACDCLVREPGPQRAFATAERVVEAVVPGAPSPDAGAATGSAPATDGGVAQTGGEELVRLDVRRTLKGPASATLTVRIPRSSCGFRFRPKETVLLYLPATPAPPLLQQCLPGLRVVWGERVDAEVATLPTARDGGR